ncbi:NUDIX hydrolase [Nocardiopsis composta]
MSDLPKHSVSVTGVVVRPDGRVLMIQRADDGRWVPPGGVLELDEAPEAGVVREVLEETGIEVKPERLVGVYKNMALGVVSLAFRCHPVAGGPRESDEAVAVEWLTIEEATAAAPRHVPCASSTPSAATDRSCASTTAPLFCLSRPCPTRSTRTATVLSKRKGPAATGPSKTMMRRPNGQTGTLTTPYMHLSAIVPDGARGVVGEPYLTPCRSL